jgi:hypothetical protein
MAWRLAGLVRSAFAVRKDTIAAVRLLCQGQAQVFSSGSDQV